MQLFTGPCPVCGGESFATAEVLFSELVRAWELSQREVAYVNRQQGMHCEACRNNLRAMALARALLREVGHDGTLRDYCASAPDLRLLEINAADSLTETLATCPGHRRIEYPEFDMQELAIESDSQDVVIHSDTLEHVPDPVRGLSECRRVLAMGGACLFTIPIIVDRLTRSRAGLAASYHGAPGTTSDDQLVHTEFGADAWHTVIEAGFDSCEIFALEYPSALVMVARK